MLRVCMTMLLVFTSSSLSLAQDKCFDPLSGGKAKSSTNPADNDRKDWDQLVQWAHPHADQEGVVRVQEIPDGMGPINLDFYSITFKKHPTKSLSDEFLDLRAHFNIFAHRGAGPYEQESATYFLPYRGSGSVTDALGARNKSLWESSEPTGAVMSFVLDNHTPALAFAATLKGIKIVLEQGDVVVTCATPLQFIFSTVYTRADGFHPVNGNRGFGIRDNGDGTWTFSTMGADRETKVATAELENGHKVDQQYFGNIALQLGFPDRGIPPGADALFVAGDKFWREFFSNLEDYLDHAGLTVNPGSFIRNTNRYPYPSH
jgi:hypothetical protein